MDEGADEGTRVRPGGDRVRRALAAEDGAEVAVEAWRGRGGHVLVWFFPEERRAALGPEENLATASRSRLVDLRASAAPLTVTERRFEAPDGTPWVAQATGPAWAGEEAAAGLVGVVFTRLAGPFERHRSRDPLPPPDEPGRLVDSWRSAAEAGSEIGEGGGE